MEMDIRAFEEAEGDELVGAVFETSLTGLCHFAVFGDYVLFGG